MKKRIHFAVTNDLVHDRRMARISTTLSDAGYAVTLIGRKLPESQPFLPKAFTGVRLPCLFRRGPLFYAEYNLRLWWWMVRHRADIRCACDLDTVPAVRLASLLSRAHTVYDAHEYFTGVPELAGRPFVRAVWAFIARLAIPGFDLRYTVGEQLAQRMAREYGVPFEVIRNIAPAPADTGPPPPFDAREKIILYQGAINVGRGLYAAIEAMAQLPDWQLWLAGQGDIDESLKAHARQLGVADRVKFLGWVAPADLPALLRRARISLNLRESGSINDYFSLPNKFFDALHAGTPSIHMDYPEYKAICSRFPVATLMDEVSAEAVVRAVNTIGDHAQPWNEMSAACLEAADTYTWTGEADRLRNMYAAL